MVSHLKNVIIMQNQFTKKVQLKNIPDGGFFTITGRNNAPIYEMQRKYAGSAMYTSTNSGLTFDRKGGTYGYIKKA